MTTYNYGKEPETSTSRPVEAPQNTIQVVVVQHKEELVRQSGNLPWTIALIKQLVPLPNKTIAELTTGISPQILNAKYVRTMSCRITKPSPNGGEPEEEEVIKPDAHLANFVHVPSRAQ